MDGLDCGAIELHELPAYLFAGDVGRLFWLRVCVPLGPALLYSALMAFLYRVTSVVGEGVREGFREADEDAAAATAATAFAPSPDDGEYEPVTPTVTQTPPCTPRVVYCVSERERLQAIKTAGPPDLCDEPEQYERLLQRQRRHENDLASRTPTGSRAGSPPPPPA